MQARSNTFTTAGAISDPANSGALIRSETPCGRGCNRIDTRNHTSSKQGAANHALTPAARPPAPRLRWLAGVRKYRFQSRKQGVEKSLDTARRSACATTALVTGKALIMSCQTYKAVYVFPVFSARAGLGPTGEA